MEQLTPYILIMHIATGCIALLAGLLALLMKKGSNNHKLNGKLFFYSMVGVAVTAAGMALIKDLDFFLMLSMFAFYSAYAGFRAIRNKTRRASIIDWLMTVGALATCGFMIMSGNAILISFGIIFMLLAASDAKDFLKKDPATIKSRRWLIVHISRMMSAYIAAVTAFFVVNFSGLVPEAFNIMVWMAPTVLFTPLIIYYTNKYRIKNESTSAAASLK